ncbi:MAG TPA: glycosyltransferase family 2 protein [Steroidobacteraceae bacterium]|nr:glycosyltransferase family 2 protein [Steroidobacteraceae bacterium]
MTTTGALLQTFWIRNWLSRFVIDKVRLTFNLLKVVTGGKTDIVGVERLSYEIFYLLNKHRLNVEIYKNYITIDGRRVRKIGSLTGAFLPVEKLVFHPDTLANIQARVRYVFTPLQPQVTHNYYMAFWFYVITFYACLAINVTMLVMYIDYYITFYTVEQWATEFWLVANSYLTLQLYIFHRTRLRFVALSGMFQEARPGEEETLMLAEECPETIILVPAYREEPELLRRSMLCHLLQKVPSKKIVLLLGNEFETDDRQLLKNTGLVQSNCESLLSLMRLYRLELSRAEEAGGSQEQAVRELLLSFAQQLERFAEEIECSPIKYPTDSFVTREVIRKMSGFFTAMANDLSSATCVVVTQYLMAFFSVDIEVFMRMKYANTEHEKTKAGNLTAYLQYINARYHEEYDEQEGVWRLIHDGESNRFEYVGIFDCDTICKPEYLLRKICYLRRTGTEEVGLIQSPYVVPVPEPSVVSVASGIQSFWFLPISIGLSGYNSSFWLGFNSCWRYSALKKIPSFIAETIIEDVEVSLQLIKHQYKIVTSPEQQCVTYSPKDLRGIQVQRTRWASGGLRILYSFVRDVLKGQYKLANTAEFVIRANYIINLNLLPIFVMLQFLIHTPLHYQYVGLIIINYCFYLVLYFRITRQYSRYSFRELFDGMIIGILMNFHYLRGLKTSVVRLFRPKKQLVFISTPRRADTVKTLGGSTVFQHLSTAEIQVDLFEIVGLILTFAIFAIAFFFNLFRGYYYDVFPLFQMFCIVYLVHRFIGFRKFFSSLFMQGGHHLLSIGKWFVSRWPRKGAAGAY